MLSVPSLCLCYNETFWGVIRSLPSWLRLFYLPEEAWLIGWVGDGDPSAVDESRLDEQDLCPRSPS